MSELKNKTYSGFLWAGIEQFGTSFLGFITQIVLARIILPEEYGIFGLIIIINAVGDIISDSGMTASLIRMEAPTRKDYDTIFVSNLAISILLYVFLFLTAPIIASYYGSPILKNIIPIYSVGIILSSFFSIQNTILRKSLDFKSITVSAIPAMIVSCILGILLAYLGFGVWSLVGMYLSKLLIQAIILTIKSHWLPGFNFDIKILKYHFGFGNKLLLATILGKTAQNITSMVIGKAFSITEVGYYVRAESLKNFLVLSFTSILEKVTYPVMAKFQSNSDKVIYNYNKMLSISNFLMSGMMFYTILVSKPLVLMLLTSTWQNSIPYLQLLCVIGVFYPFGVFSHNIILLKGKSNIILFLSIVMEVSTIGGVLYFSQFSIVSIIQFLITLQILMMLPLFIFIKKLYGFKIIFQINNFLHSLLPTFSTFVISYFLFKYLKLEQLNNLTNILFGAGVYFTILALITIFFKNDMYKNILEIIMYKKNNR